MIAGSRPCAGCPNVVTGNRTLFFFYYYYHHVCVCMYGDIYIIFFSVYRFIIYRLSFIWLVSIHLLSLSFVLSFVLSACIARQTQNPRPICAGPDRTRPCRILTWAKVLEQSGFGIDSSSVQSGGLTSRANPAVLCISCCFMRCCLSVLFKRARTACVHCKICAEFISFHFILFYFIFD